MKKALFLNLLLVAIVVHSQPIVQPVSSGDYWQIDEYENRLPELANNTTFPVTLQFLNGFASLNNFYVTKLTGANEIVWNLGTVKDVSKFVVEWSRDLKTFERAGILQFLRADGITRYVFRHQFEASPLVYYRLGIISASNTIAYTPAVQVLDEEYTTKIYPTIVKGSSIYVQTARAYEKFQVLNAGNQSVYEKGISGQTGTVSIGLPSLPKGIYFVRLLASNQPQYVEKIVVE